MPEGSETAGERVTSGTVDIVNGFAKPTFVETS